MAGRDQDDAAPRELDAAYAGIARRILPLAILLMVMAWLDRVNVGFAKLQMLDDLGLSEAVFGFGAGVFYLGYFLFEVPSNLFLARIGARKTLSRIAILWGLASTAMMFVRGAMDFYVLRFLLGAFEAGLYPGVILYLTYWFPSDRRARMTALFMTAVPLAGMVGGPVSGWILNSMGGPAGLANWQWLFLLEGLPTVAIGLLALIVIDDSPRSARWLTDRQRQLVLADLEADRRHAGTPRHSIADAVRLPQVWLLTVIYFLLVSANPTLGFWNPTIINGMGVESTFSIGLLSAIPYAVSIVAVVLVAKSSDKRLERRYHCAVPCALTAAGLILIGVFQNHPTVAFLSLVLSVAGVLSAFPPFWQVPTVMLTGTAAAGGIALINSIGNLSGWVAPALFGWLLDLTGSTRSGLYVVAGFELLAAVLILAFIPPVRGGTRQRGETTEASGVPPAASPRRSH